MAEQDKNVWSDLRKPFPKEVIGLLPKVSCYACNQATKSARSPLDKHCDRHKMIKCADCGAFITEGHIHLDYVGHAAVTDRLNQAVGPENWTWNPMGVTSEGVPALDKDGNLWIELSINGVTKPGVGDGANMKERIGDALRNAAMRFGVALDLWSKDELESTLEAPDLKNEKPSQARTPEQNVKDAKTVFPEGEAKFARRTSGKPMKPAQSAKIYSLGRQLGIDQSALEARVDQLQSEEEADEAIAKLEEQLNTKGEAT